MFVSGKNSRRSQTGRIISQSGITNVIDAQKKNIDFKPE